ncbi:MAG: rod shape-determining protein MreC, partial [Candidatus Moranbacteria bacterium]|nr:rod shape-determining protein MreC [Candidatus Moranbacteria bacterium]
MNGWRSIQKTRLFRVIVVCGVLFGLIAWNPHKVFYPVRVVFGFVAAPFQSVLSVIGFYADSSLEFLSSISHLKEDNERLYQENIRLLAENAKLIDMRQENEMLRKEFELLPRGSFDLMAAEVVGMDQQNTGNWLLINKGFSDGIQK